MIQKEDAVRLRASSQKTYDFSVVVPICERHDDLKALYLQYAKILTEKGKCFEFIFVVDGAHPEALETLKPLMQSHSDIKVIVLNRSFGEATALSVGFEQTSGTNIITLAAYFQVVPEELSKTLDVFEEKGDDLVITRRFPRIDSFFNRLQSRVFHLLMRLLTGAKYHDVSCGLRIMHRKVAEEVHLYGDLHRFLPLLAHQKGFSVIETPVRQNVQDKKNRLQNPGVYLRRLLDILTLFFLFKFTRKPLRFFGLVGSSLFGTGALITVYLAIYRFMGLGGIAGRPLLVLGVLLMVLGVQLFSIGLLGEIIIFTHASETKDYQVKEIRE